MSQPPGHNVQEAGTRVAILKIESIFEGLANSILHDHESLLIELKRRLPPKPRSASQQGLPTDEERSRARQICFPGKTSREAWIFTVLVRILELVHETLVHNTIITKREIFYKDPKLFVRQSAVDRYVEDLAFTLGVERRSLNVVAAAKGLVAGPLAILRKDGSVIRCDHESEGVMIPDEREIQEVQQSEVQWYLVIENEATFRALAACAYWKNSGIGKGVLLTAKGYPDVSSRSFLRRLTTHEMPSHHVRPPVFGLVDFDPDGINILSTFKHGSTALAHESHNLTTPETIWLGVRSTDIPRIELTGDRRGVQTLTARDRRKARIMLGKKLFKEPEAECGWRIELQTMLMLNVKAEIQMLSDVEGGLEPWLDMKIAAETMDRSS